ncbi:MAG: hypothetical protein Q8P80_04375 [Candidatus Levybacteria bacterium]|nr:hypothetical protein [Candidatus Levybacteria bacterium]
MKLSILWLFSLIAIFSFFFTTSVFAVTITITDFPSSKPIGEEFTVNFNAEGLSSGTYYGKVRIGKFGTTSNKAETKNGEEWLGDSGTWIAFPVFTTDGSTPILGSLTARAKSTAEAGENLLFVRLNKGNNYDSSSVTIVLNEALTPTPIPPTITPTSSPSPTPTNTPTPTKSSISTKTPSPTPNPTKISTPTIKPLATLMVNEEESLVSISPEEILGTETAILSSISAEPTKETVRTLGSVQNNLPKILFGIGSGFFILCGILTFRKLKMKNEK